VTNEQIAQVLKIGIRTINRIKKKFVEAGMDATLERRPSSRIYEQKVDGEIEAKLLSLCCSDSPKGFAKWSLRFLANKMVELKYIDIISYLTV